MKKGITLISLVITIIIMLILAGVGIAGSLALIEQAKYTAQANDLQQKAEAFEIYVLEKQLEGAGSTVNLYEGMEAVQSESELPKSLQDEIKYARELVAGNVDVENDIPSDFADNALEIGEEGKNIYYLPSELTEGKEEAYVYDEQSASVYKVEPTIIWGVEMHGYDYGNLLVSRPGLLERAQGNIKEEGESSYQENLIAWYDGINNTQEGHSYETTTWTDLTGNNKTGATINGATWTPNGLIFDGEDDWVNMNSILMPESDNFAIDVVFSLNKYSSDSEYILGQNISSSGAYRTGFAYAKSMFFYNVSSSSWTPSASEYTSIDSQYTPKLTEKVNVTIIRDSNVLQIWINGEKKAEQNTTDLKIYQGNTILGRWGMNSNFYLNGVIYSVKAYNKELTEEEIKQNYLENVERYEINNYGDESSLNYTQEGLTAWYDGIKNTQEGHTYEITNWADLTGKNETGATVVGATWTPNGLILDGTDDYVNMNSILIPETTNFTLDIVFSINKYKSNQYILGHNVRSVTPANRFGIGLWDSELRLFSPKITNSTINTGYRVNLTEKINMTIVREDTNIEIWVNGIKKAETTASGFSIYQTNTLLGSWALYSDLYLNGIIYSVRTYNRGLADEEIIQNYNVDKLRFAM